MKLAIVQTNPIVGALRENCEKILAFIAKAKKGGAEMILFSELALCGYSPDDLLLLPDFLEEVEKSAQKIALASQGVSIFLGLPRRNPGPGKKRLFNSAAVMTEGKLLGYQDKALLPDYDVFFERRYFEPGQESHVWELHGKRVGVTICEDLWQDEECSYLHDPVEAFQGAKLDLLVNLSASPYYPGRVTARERICKRAVHLTKAPIAYCNQVGGNDRLIFDGYSFFMNMQGEITHLLSGFTEDIQLIDLTAPAPPLTLSFSPTQDLAEALILGLRDYFHKQGFTKAILGISGGIDSAVVAVIAREALGAENVLGLFIPSRFTSKETLRDSYELVKRLGIAHQEVSIEPLYKTMLSVLQPHFAGKPQDVTEENLQARMRGMILMAFSNKFGYIVLGTGNKSEMAMGYATLYGDMCGGIGVIADVSKQGVYDLARWFNREKELIPLTILQKEPSAELKENQKDRDTLPSYDIIDAVLVDYVEEHCSVEQIVEKRGFSKDLVEELVRKIHRNEYKRRQAPPGLKVTKRAFTAGRRFPIVQKWVRDASEET